MKTWMELWVTWVRWRWGCVLHECFTYLPNKWTIPFFFDGFTGAGERSFIKNLCRCDRISIWNKIIVITIIIICCPLAMQRSWVRFSIWLVEVMAKQLVKLRKVYYSRGNKGVGLHNLLDFGDSEGVNKRSDIWKLELCQFEKRTELSIITWLMPASFRNERHQLVIV